MAIDSPSLNLPFAVLTPITGKPTYMNTQLLIRQVFANASAVPSNIGGGAHGHLGMVMAADVYANLQVVVPPAVAIPWVNPAHPGNVAVIPPGATAAQITDLHRAFDAAEKTHLTFMRVQAALREGILTAVQPAFLMALDDPLLGFSQVTPRDIIVHLIASYQEITADEIQANLDRLKEPWNPDESVELLWKRALDCQTFATAGLEPINDAVVVRVLFKTFEDSGMLTDHCFIWRRVAPALRTMAAFKEHFTTAIKEYEDKRTAKSTGFHGANAAVVATTGAPATASTTKPRTAAAQAVCGTVNLYYCHTHGLGLNKNHTSELCKHPATTGHQTTATLFDMQGGSTRISIGKREKRTNSEKE
jgi:hypothetical protein